TLGITVSYAEALWPPAKRFSCIALRRRHERAYQQRLGRAKACILPEPVRGEVVEMVRKQGRVSARLLQRIRDCVQRWYHGEGFVCAQVINFGNLDAGEVLCEVVEGEVTGVEYQFQDKLGNVVEGNTQLPVIDRELPQQLRPGHIFNIGAGKQALKNINALGLFSNIEASIQPGGGVTFEHRNICGLNRSLAGSFSSSNLLNPQDDVSFKLEYTHPYLDGVEDRSRNRIFKASCFNTKKLSPVFNLTKQSKFTYGLVLEEITTRDESNDVCTHGLRTKATGALGMDGPPTTFSGTGVDRMAFLHANVTRDNTEFVNGETIGDRCIFQVDQGLGIGSRNPFFNRHQLTVTKFVNLNKQEKGAGKPPPAVLVAHGRYAGCVGDLPSYDAFALGGPHSVRGYGMGELGACRNLLETTHCQLKEKGAQFRNFP
uniref:Uncharacterized protein n=1 Tax=Aegilops tauschii subsp. strangulata TaxID=200361 RepID=A0A453HPB7_AEGTS